VHDEEGDDPRLLRCSRVSARRCSGAAGRLSDGPIRSLGRSFTGAATLLIMLLGTSAARANISAPWSRGDLAGEPRDTALSKLEVIAETLRFDLRALARNERAAVEVRYRLRNPGPARVQLLRFVSPGVASATVRFDDRAVEGVTSTKEAIPEAWRKVLSTPALEGGGTQSIELARELRLLTFQVPLKAGGEHTLFVRYTLRAATQAQRVYLEHQVAYLLAPAKQFGRFGTLDVEVELPPGWRARAEPALGRQGDKLSGHFVGLPADALGITLARPSGVGPWGWLFVVFLGLVGLVASVIVTRWLAQRAVRLGGGATFFATLGAGLIAGLVVFGFLWLGQALWNATLDATQVSSHWKMGLTFGYLFTGMPLLVLWCIALMPIFLKLRSRARARLPITD
jgi:hypothetical protein